MCQNAAAGGTYVQAPVDLMLSAVVNVRSKSGCNVPSWYKKMKDMSVSHSEIKRDK